MALIDHPKSLENLLRQLKHNQENNPKNTNPPPRKRVLVVQPRFFTVSYAINPYMKDEQGALKKVDTSLALDQWKNLIKAFELSGLDVQVLDGRASFPDMVFAANQSFPFWNAQSKTYEVILSNMNHQERKGEVPFFADWFASQNYKIHSLPHDMIFEGTGDALLDPVRPLIWCGFGYRTSPQTLARISEITKTDLIPLELKNPYFYHLDTCFAPLTEHSAVVVKEAFTDEGLALLQTAFEQLIYCSMDEAQKSLGANLFCPNGRDIFIDQANHQLIEELQVLGFRIQTLQTSEFIKSGGSVFCLKLHLW